MGFFSVNNGEIKNLYIEKSKFNIEITTNKFHAIGILVGHNVDDGIVENCAVEGKIDIITSYSGNIGGLCGANDGNVKSCYSSADIDTKRSENANEKGQLRFGGVVGASSKNIDGIYFNGSLILNYLNNNILDTSAMIGGLVGYVSNESKLINSYSVGFINSSCDVDDIQIGPLSFSYGDFGKICENCYYLRDTINASQNNKISNYPAIRHG